MPPHRGLYFIDNVYTAAWVLLEFANGSPNKAREVIAAIGKMKIPPRESRKADAVDLLLMAASLRPNHERSDAAAIRRVIIMQHGEPDITDYMVHALRYWLKGKTLEKFASAQSYSYIFEPPDEFVGQFGQK